MQSRFVYYSNRIVRLPKGIGFLVFLLLLVLIPLLLALFIVGSIATLLVRNVTSLLLPSKKTSLKYDEYEVIEVEESKKLSN